MQMHVSPRSVVAGLIFSISVPGLPVSGAPIQPGNPVVSQAGDGSLPLSDAGSIAVAREFNRSGNAVQTVEIPFTAGGLQLQAGRGGKLAVSEFGQAITMAGYIPPFTGGGQLAGRTEAEAKRGIIEIGLDGNVSQTTVVGGFPNRAADAAVASGGSSWVAGSDSLVYSNGGNSTKIFESGGIFAPFVGPTAVKISDRRLYFSATRSFPLRGFIANFKGLPTAAGADYSVLFDVDDPRDFVVSPDGNTMYVALGSGRVQKWEKSSGNWRKRYDLNTEGRPLNGVAVDFGRTNPTVFAVSDSALWMRDDSGSSGSMKRIANAGANVLFRGIAVPVPSSDRGGVSIELLGPQRFATSRSRVRIRGLASSPAGIRAVRYRSPTADMAARASGRRKWRFTADLKPGRNLFIVRAIDRKKARSAPLRIVITRR